MENNKYYLNRLFLPFFLAVAYGLVYVAVPLFFDNNIDLHESVLLKIVYPFYHVLFFAALGHITKKWPAAVTAICVAACMQGLAYVFFNNGYSLPQFLYFELIFLFSSLLFLYLSERKSITGKTFFITAILLLISTQSYFGTQLMADSGYVRILFFTIKAPSVIHSVIVFLSISIPFLLKFLFFAEIINYYKVPFGNYKTRLLNLGNEYPDKPSLAVLCVLNIGLLFCMAKGTEIVGFNLFYNNPPEYFQMSNYKGLYGSMAVNSLCIIPFFMLYGWYYRKFLLEYFIVNGQTSKFLFWFCFIPFIGIIALFVATGNNNRQISYKEKLNTLSAFAGNSNTNVLVTLGVILLLRGLIVAANGAPAEILGTFLSLFFLYLMSISKGVWQFVLWLNVVVMAGILVFSLFYRLDAENPISLIMGLIAVNAISLMMLLPVLHINAFEYVPDTDPDEDPAEITGDLFPEYSRY